jgi:pilus assembly protein CpaE
MLEEPAPRVLIVEYNRILTAHLYRILAQEGYIPIVAETAAEALRLAKEERPDLAIVDAKLPDMEGYVLTRQFREDPATQGMPVLLLRRDNDTASKIAVIEAGVTDHMTQPFNPYALIYRVKSVLVRHEAPDESLIGADKHRSIAFFGCKGGVGATTLAVNLAVALHQRGGGRMVLFDANFAFGDIGVHLDMNPPHSVIDLVKHIEELDPAYVDQVLADYQGYMRILLGPRLPEQADMITPDHIQELLDKMSRFSDYLIIDCPTSYNEQTLTILEHVDDIMLVTTPEVSAIRNTSVFLNLASRLNWPDKKIRIILNRANSNQQIGLREIERTLHRQVEFSIINSRKAVVQSLTRGQPLVLEQPTHQLSQQILEMADRLLGRVQLPALESKPGSGSLLKRNNRAPTPRRLPKAEPTIPAPPPYNPTPTKSLWKKLLNRVAS